MGNPNRRFFLQSAVAAGMAPFLARHSGAQQGEGPRLGMYLVIRQDPNSTMAKARELGFSLCQVYTGELDPQAVTKLGEAIKRHRMEVTSLFTMGPGTQEWDFYQGGCLCRLNSPGASAHRTTFPAGS